MGVTALLAAVVAGPAGVAAQTLVKAAPGAVEVKSTYGRTWVSVPDVLWNIRMDRNGQIIATAAPVTVAHEDASGPLCRGALSISALASNGDPGRIVTFPPPGSCNFDAAQATLVLPADSAVKYARICNSTAREVAPPMNCHVETNGQVHCEPWLGPPIPALPGDAWRRAEGWTGRVPYNGVLSVIMAYNAPAIDRLKDLVNPGVQVTCDAVPCVTFTKELPEAVTGRPYRALLFSGARPPVTIMGAKLPAGLSLGTDGYLSGTPTEPGLQDLSISFTDSYACPWNLYTITSKGGNSQWLHGYKLTVRDGEPPVITGYTVTPDTLPAGGGNVAVTLQLTDKVGVSKVFSSRTAANGAGNTSTMNMTSGSPTNGTWTVTWPVAANTTTTPAAYTIKSWAVDYAGNQVNATARTITVAGTSGEPLRRLEPIRR